MIFLCSCGVRSALIMSRSRGNTTLGADQLVSARRTESVDAAAITKLVGASTQQVFGRINIVNLM